MAFIEPIVQTAYDREVKRAYGDRRTLYRAVRTRQNVIGDNIHFRRKSKGMATPHQKGSDITAMNTKYMPVPCYLKGWEAFDFVDELDVTKFNFDEIRENSEVAGDALGLRSDQIIIDAISAACTTGNNNLITSTASAAMTVDNLIEASKIFNAVGVPQQDRYALITAQQHADLLADEKLTSVLFTDLKALVPGAFNKFMGFQFMLIASNRLEGGLPHGAAYDQALFFDRNAVGYAEGRDFNVKIEWSVEKQGWWIGGKFYAGAVTIDPLGVLGMQTLADNS